MNGHASVRNLVHPPARLSRDLSKLACALRLSLAAVTIAPAAHAQAPATSSAMTQLLQGQVAPPLTELERKLDKRGFLSFVFDGRYKFARYYAPANFNTPETLEQILRDNDIQLFDLKHDPLETHNLVVDAEKNTDLILRMN